MAAAAVRPVSQEPPAAVPVLLLTADPALIEAVQRLAVSAGVELVIAAEPPAPRVGGRGLVLVGPDAAPALARRRGSGTAGAPGIVLVAAAAERGLASGGSGAAWQLAVAIGAEQVALLPEAGDWLVRRLAGTVEPSARARVVGVLGGCGGAGASLFAAALAIGVAAQAAPTLLVDLDPLGGGIDLAVGLDDVAGLRWPDLAATRGRLPAGSLHESLPRAGALAVLGFGRDEPLDVPAAAVDAVLDAGVRGHDLVVLDLPRSLDGSHDLALSRVDELLVVVPSRLRAVAAAAQLVAAVGARVPSLRVVVRRVPGGRWSGHRVADVLGVPLAAELQDEPRLDDDLDRGELPGQRRRSSLARAVEQCAAAWGHAGHVA